MKTRPRASGPSGAKTNKSEASSSEMVESAFAKCRARVDRLEKLNGVIEELSKEDWNSSIHRDQLSLRLRNNPYHDAIQQQLKAVKLNWLRSNPDALDVHTPEDLGISAQARQLGSEAAAELLLLKQLEHRSAQTMVSMLDFMSEDVPLCEEEVLSALMRVRCNYNSAKCSLNEALKAAVLKKEERDPGFMKKGHLSEESICVLQDWLVDHFEHPYPTPAEKEELVRMTGVSQQQINNWMSNARVRIWRPTVEKLGKK